MFSTEKEESATKNVEPRGDVREQRTRGSFIRVGKERGAFAHAQNVGSHQRRRKRNTFNRLVLEVHYLDPNSEVSTNNNRKGKSGVIVHAKKGFPISSAATLIWATGFVCARKRGVQGRDDVRTTNESVESVWV